jgi:hypothetical protein
MIHVKRELPKPNVEGPYVEPVDPADMRDIDTQGIIPLPPYDDPDKIKGAK